jgi:hypothetical protein
VGNMALNWSTVNRYRAGIKNKIRHTSVRGLITLELVEVSDSVKIVTFCSHLGIL